LGEIPHLEVSYHAFLLRKEHRVLSEEVTNHRLCRGLWVQAERWLEALRENERRILGYLAGRQGRWLYPEPFQEWHPFPSGVGVSEEERAGSWNKFLAGQAPSSPSISEAEARSLSPEIPDFGPTPEGSEAGW
jgi:hypothetical protein